jgi:hypothetical protein
MDFAPTARVKEYEENLLDFMDTFIYPNEAVYEE